MALPKVFYLGCIVLLLAIVEATPPGIANHPAKASCKIKKYKMCYNLEHVCPKFCPDGCEVECASCKPICTSGSSAPPVYDSPPTDDSTPPVYVAPPSDDAGGDKGGKKGGDDSEGGKKDGGDDKGGKKDGDDDKGGKKGGDDDKGGKKDGDDDKGGKKGGDDSGSPSGSSPPYYPPTTPTPSTPSPSTPYTPPTPVTPTPSTPSTPSPSPPTPKPPTPTPPTPTPTYSPPPSTPSPTPSTPTPTTPTPSTPTPTPSTPTPTYSPPPSTPTPTPSTPTPPTPTPSTPTPTPSTPSPSPSTPTPVTPSPSTPSTPTPTPSTPYPTPATPSPSPPTPTPATPSPSTPTPTTPSTPSTPTPVTPSPSTPSTPTPTPATPSPSTPYTPPSTPSTPPSSPTPTPSTPSSPTPTPSTPSWPSTPTTPPSSGVSPRKRVRCMNKGYGTCYGVQHTCPASCPTSCQVDCNACKPVCSCDYPGAVCQDPRFIGGDGITFYFHGKKDKDFCLVTDPNLHINAHFIGKRNSNMTRDFTWVQSIGILFDENHRLFLGAQKTSTWDDANDRLALTFDGEPIFLQETQNTEWKSTSNPQVTITRTSDTNNIVLEIQDKLKITAKVVPITEEESRVHNYDITKDDCFAHLDLGFKFYELSQGVDGVLGKTYRDDYVSKVKMGVAMPVMGGDREYSTSSLFAPDCLVSRFNNGGDHEDDAALQTLELTSMNCASGMSGEGVVCKR